MAPFFKLAFDLTPTPSDWVKVNFEISYKSKSKRRSLSLCDILKSVAFKIPDFIYVLAQSISEIQQLTDLVALP